MALKSPGGLVVLWVIYPKASNRLSGFWSPGRTCPWHGKMAAQRPCGRFRGGSGATCTPRHEGPPSLGIWRVTGRRGSQSRPGHALLLRAALSDCKQSSHGGAQAQRRAVPRPASQPPGTQADGDRHMPLRAHQPWVPACSARKPLSPSLPHRRRDSQTDREQDSNSDLENGPRLPSQLLSPNPGSPAPLLPALGADTGSRIEHLPSQALRGPLVKASWSPQAGCQA